MPRFSETIAALAAALAKAQAELVNPEKSMTGTIRGLRPGEASRSFQYAPLSSGLDTVRKTLGKHEIATMQTTAIDQLAGMVQLTTTLAHSSGEWIASEWPVCPVAELANPQRMGLALTYARRYALFTLAGIAGEDDLDAPDLCAEPDVLGSARPVPSGNAQPPLPRREPGNGHGRGIRRGQPWVMLDPDQSAKLRDKMLIEISTLASSDLTMDWAKQGLAAKNTLTAADAKLVEAAFERRLAELASAGEAPAPGTGIDKSILALAVPRRYRDREHLRYVMQQPCVICGRKPSDPHHLRYLQPRALGRKASDEFAVPLCRAHHREVHRAGDERAWWRQAGIDPIHTACRLWKATRGIGQRRPKPAASPRPHRATASSSPKSEDIGATATLQEETRLPDRSGQMREDRQ
jgi:ERF superfamily protein